ncbi:MAG TPA: succinate dehydrogenase assembly factor 2 [Xanthomonadales bacterium]|nr:succinate dehydrogenase assembly factor 2 [Xanthomonadales bacterium]
MEQAPPPAGDMRLRKLKWLCRRGMKELDVLLEDFLASNTAALQAGEWPELEDLLALEDDQLWDYVLNPDANRTDRFHRLLFAISRVTAQPD